MLSAEITSAELTQIRSDIEALLPDTGYILEKALVPDGMGGNQETWGTASGGTVSCRLDPVAPQREGRETMVGNQVVPYSKWVITLPYGTSIDEADRIEIASIQYAVVAEASEHSWAGCVRVFAEKVS